MGILKSKLTASACTKFVQFKVVILVTSEMLFSSFLTNRRCHNLLVLSQEKDVVVS